MSVKFFSAIIIMMICMLIIELIRREKLTFKYAFGWLLAVVGGALIILAEPVFQTLATAFGFQLLSNFIFFCCMGIAMVLGLLLTVFLCQQDRRNEMLAKRIALLENEIRNSNFETR